MRADTVESESVRDLCPDCGEPLRSGMGEVCQTCLLLLGLEGGSGSRDLAPLAEDERRLGNYQLLDEIARGGMGVVYRARQLDLDRVVALKLLLAGEWASEGFVERFRTEARAAAALDHPDIVPLFEHGEEDGQWFLAMKYVEGGSLAQHLDEHGPMAPRAAVKLVARMARAVHYAHQRGILHRDLKPANILLDLDGHPYLTDFGLARLTTEGSGVALTRTMAVLGTPAYLAPEQASGDSRSVTTAADVYCLGALLYEALAGKPVFIGKSAVDTVRMVIDDEAPSLSSSNPELSRELDAVCAACLQKNPRDRYPSAQALAEDLERWLRGETLTVRPAGTAERALKWVRRHPWPTAVAAVVGLALATVATVSLLYNLRLNAASEEIATLAENRERELSTLNVSNGNREAAAGDSHTALLWFAHAAALDQDRPEREFAHRLRFSMTLRQSPQPLEEWTHDGAATQAIFSRDGRWIASSGSGGSVSLSDRQGGAGKTLFLKGHIGSLSISPDGSHLAARTREGRIAVWSTATGDLACDPMPTQRAPDARSGLVQPVQFLPDSSGFVLEQGNRALLCNLDGTVRLGIDFAHPVSHASLSPDGSRLAICSVKTGLIRIHDRVTGEALCEAEHNGGWQCLYWSPDGESLVACYRADFRVVLLSADDLSITHLAAHREFTFLVQPDPAGKRWLFFGYDEYARIADETLQWIGPPMRQQGLINAAAWDPAHQRVVTAGTDGVVRLWDAGTGKALPGIMHHLGGATHASFSPDGTKLLTAGVDGIVRLWQLPPPDGAAARVDQRSPTQRSDFTRDGRFVASTSLANDVTIWNAESGEFVTPPLVHPGRPITCAWSEEDSVVLTLMLDGSLRRWAVREGGRFLEKPVVEEVIQLPLEKSTGHFFTPEGSMVGARTAEGLHALYHTRDGSLAWETDSFISYAREPAFAADGSRMVWPGHQGRFWVIRTEDGAILEEIVPPTGGGESALCLSDDLGKACVLTRWTQVLIRDRLDGATIGAGRHLSEVFMAKFIHEGRMLATSSSDSTIRLWDVETGEPIGAPLPHGNRTLTMNLSPDGTRLLSHCSDVYVRLWDISVEDWTPEEMERIALRVAGHRLAGNGELVGLDPSERISLENDGEARK